MSEVVRGDAYSSARRPPEDHLKATDMPTVGSLGDAKPHQPCYRGAQGVQNLSSRVGMKNNGLFHLLRETTVQLCLSRLGCDRSELDMSMWFNSVEANSAAKSSPGSPNW